MSYTFLITKSNSTDMVSRTFTVAKSLLWLVVLFFVLAPFAVYLVTYYYIAPIELVPQVGKLRKDLQETQYRVSVLETENNVLQSENERFAEENALLRQENAEFETRVAIAENARITTANKSQELEEEVYELRQSLNFYEAFVKPATENDILQCFNISVSYKKKKIKYALNFLRTDQTIRKRIDAVVKFRILTGSNVLDLDIAAEDGQVSSERKISLVKDKRLKGDFPVEVASSGLRVLDIRTYNKTNEVIAHCWKAF